MAHEQQDELLTSGERLAAVYALSRLSAYVSIKLGQTIEPTDGSFDSFISGLVTGYLALFAGAGFITSPYYSFKKYVTGSK